MKNYFPKQNYVTISVYHPTKDFWYVWNINKWKELHECTLNDDFSSHYYGKCKSKKALIRKLLKWNLPKGTKIRVELSDDSIINLSVH